MCHDIDEKGFQMSSIIRGQEFDDALISGEGIDVDEEEEGENGDGEETENAVQIVGSGTIDVTEGANDGEEGDDEEDDEDEANSYNTDIEPYSTILSDGDSITVNSST